MAEKSEAMGRTMKRLEARGNATCSGVCGLLYTLVLEPRHCRDRMHEKILLGCFKRNVGRLTTSNNT